MAALVGRRPGYLYDTLRSCSCTARSILVVQTERTGQEVPREERNNPVDGFEQEGMADGKGPREDRDLVHILGLKLAAAIPEDKTRHIVVYHTVGSGR